MESEPFTPSRSSRRIILAAFKPHRRYLKVPLGTYTITWDSDTDTFDAVALYQLPTTNQPHFRLHLTETLLELEVDDAYRECILVRMR